jgi:hypothetical protein
MAMGSYEGPDGSDRARPPPGSREFPVPWHLDVQLTAGVGQYGLGPLAVTRVAPVAPSGACLS